MMELVDMVSWDAALAATTSTTKTKRLIASAIEIVRNTGNGRVEVAPPMPGGSVNVKLYRRFSVPPGWCPLATIVLTPGCAAEVYDVPPRSYSRLPLQKLAWRADGYHRGWS